MTCALFMLLFMLTLLLLLMMMMMMTMMTVIMIHLPEPVGGRVEETFLVTVKLDRTVSLRTLRKNSPTHLRTIRPQQQRDGQMPVCDECGADAHRCAEIASRLRSRRDRIQIEIAPRSHPD